MQWLYSSEHINLRIISNQELYHLCHKLKISANLKLFSNRGSNFWLVEALETVTDAAKF